MNEALLVQRGQRLGELLPTPRSNHSDARKVPWIQELKSR